jgi:large subunit ribosomal protein L25
MKTVSLSGSLRGSVGKKDAKLQRRAGKIPCVLYGGPEQIHFVADEKSFSKILFTPEVNLIRITIDGKEYDTIYQEIQFHPVTDKLLHVDFLQVLPDKPVTIAIPVKSEGVSPGVLKGGRLEKKMRKVKIRALIKDLPDFIMVDISPMDIGDSARVGDLKIPNVTFLDAPNNVIIGVRTARQVIEEVVPGAEVAAEAAEGAEGAEKKEEGKKEAGKKEEKGK